MAVPISIGFEQPTCVFIVAAHGHAHAFMTKTKTSPQLVVNEIAKPEFRGDKLRLIRAVEGFGEDFTDANTIPPCHSDPNLESGICNPQLPLTSSEPCECVFAKSCLVAKLLSCGIPVNVAKAAQKPYEQVLAEADELFERQQRSVQEADPSIELVDRQHARAHVASIPLQPPVNPFRRHSLRRLVLDLLIRDWTTLGDLKAAVLSVRNDAARLDTVIAQVTSLATQETNNYRIVESFGKYKAFSARKG